MSLIDNSFALSHRLNFISLPKPLPLKNSDGSPNGGDVVTHYVSLMVYFPHGHQEMWHFVVAHLNTHEIFLGHDWLKFHNPQIDWQQGSIMFSRCPSVCGPSVRSIQMLVSTPPDWKAEFPDVFSEEEYQRLPEPRPGVDLPIDLTNPRPFKAQIYPMNRERREALSEWVDENLASGRIRPSRSQYSCPVFFKDEGDKLRLIVDYSKLNEVTVPINVPLPLIRDIFDNVKDSSIFSKMDIRWGFHNLRIREGDEYKAAFATHLGLFEPVVMQFGMTNAPAGFQELMNEVLRDEIQTGHVFVFIDDIIVHTKDLDLHRKLVRQVLEKLRENHLYVREKKCEFEKSEILFLGHIISEGEIRHSPKKCSGLRDWPQPLCKKDVERFLGLTNYYRRFVPGYASLARPLDKLRGGGPWEWTHACEEAFTNLKNMLVDAPALAIPKDDGLWKVETDASTAAIGAVLSQKQPDGQWRMVDCISHALSPTEQRYAIYDREFLAVIRALETWTPYLLAAKEAFEIHSDHANLQYFRKAQKLSPRQMRWTSKLSMFKYRMVYVKGSSNVPADALSRRPDHDVAEVEEQPAVFPDLVEVNNVVTFALNADERMEVLRNCHDSPWAGHPGVDKTVELIRRNHWWPNLVEDVRSYVAGCTSCQRNKPLRNRKKAQLVPLPVPGGPWEEISWDIIGPLPESAGRNAILVIVDRFTKRTLLEPVNDTLTAEGAARVLVDRVIRNHGVPKRIVSDRGPQFNSSFMRETCRALGIGMNMSTAFHPRTDGQTERHNQEVETYLRHFINYRQDDWTSWITPAEFALNNRKHSATGFSPFELDMGRQPNVPGFAVTSNKNPRSLDVLKDLKVKWAECQRRLHKMVEVMRLRKGTAVDFEVGEEVWLDSTNLNTSRPMKKLAEKRLGPFKILEKVGHTSYHLNLPISWKIHPVFHSDLLSRFHKPVYDVQKGQLAPLPVVIDQQEEFEVSKVLDSRLYRGKLQFLVQWKGYPLEDSTWEPEKNLENATELVSEFYQLHPGAPRRLNVNAVFLPREDLCESKGPSRSWWMGCFRSHRDVDS